MRLSRTLGVWLLASAAFATSACGDDDTQPPPSTAPDASDAGDDTTSDATEPPTDVAPGDAAPPPDTDEDVSAETGPDPDAEPPLPDLDWCDGATHHLWDPIAATDLEFFPDGTLVRDDPESPTGLRIDISDDTTPWLAQVPPILSESVRAFNDLSGFGALGGALLRFDEPVQDVPRTWEESVEGTGWLWLDLSTDPPERVPFEARILEEGRTVVLWPLRPLRLATEHMLVVTRDVVADDGGCIAPSAATRSLLHGAPLTERLAAFAPGWRAALARTSIAPEDVSAITVFTTHNDLLPIRLAAERVLEADVAWVRPGTHGDCVERAGTLQCEARTTVLDFRDERRIVDGSVDPVEAEIPVTYWLPAEGEGPFPVLVYGHGLNSERDEGWEIASRLTPRGFAVVSMEAVEHGEHPSVDPDIPRDATDLPALRFLGIDLAGFRINSRAIRGNFNQTNIDRLRLIRLVRTQPDIDGDGIPDFDTDRVAYVGASLGAICGSGLLALSPDIDAAALLIGGARLISIVTDTDAIAQYRPLIDRLVRSPTAFDRLMPVAQHLIDPADSGTWAAHVLRDRFDDRLPPSIVVPVGLFDEVVPPASGRALARALGAPHMAPVIDTVELLDVVDENPLQANWADGERTAGFFQLDRVSRDGRVRTARHVDTAKSDEVGHILTVFFEDWAAGRVPSISDPYAALETPPLED
jgi:dienelactone hydrolase